MTDLITKYSEELFHIPYLLTQNAIGETDGGVASIFEETADGSGFADAGGEYVIDAILKSVGEQDFVDGIVNLYHKASEFEPLVKQRYDDAEYLIKADIPSICEEVAVVWHNALKGTFPTIEAADIDKCLPQTKRALSAYLDVQYAYTKEFNGEEVTNSAPRM